VSDRWPSSVPSLFPLPKLFKGGQFLFDKGRLFVALRRQSLAIVGMLCLLVACSPGAPPKPTARPTQINVAAAADLQFAFQEIGELFEKETGTQVVFIFGSSGQLAQQIENGAPFDAFAAASIFYIEQLKEKGLIRPETQRLYAQGRIALVVNRAGGVQATRLEDLLQPSIRNIAIANPDHAPYGAAAREALESLGLWETVRPKLVYGENVRQALQFVQTGNAEAGIVALSVANVPDVTYTVIDDRLHKPLNQAMAVLVQTSHPSEASAFLDFVNSPQGRSVMKRYGFLLPGEF
jgi:molybdate transport system substrate-binding protein